MTTTEAILNYVAKKRRTFLRKDLLVDVASQLPDINKRAIDLQLSRLVASGIILRKERGIYTLAENVLPEYAYRPSEYERDLKVHRARWFLELLCPINYPQLRTC